jgi:hypothetical protein
MKTLLFTLAAVLLLSGCTVRMAKHPAQPSIHPHKPVYVHHKEHRKQIVIDKRKIHVHPVEHGRKNRAMSGREKENKHQRVVTVHKPLHQKRRPGDRQRQSRDRSETHKNGHGPKNQPVSKRENGKNRQSGKTVSKPFDEKVLSSNEQRQNRDRSTMQRQGNSHAGQSVSKHEKKKANQGVKHKEEKELSRSEKREKQNKSDKKRKET